MKWQRGVALVTVLLVVAVATVVCSAIIARQQLTIRSSANQLHVRQAWHYALGGEVLARSVLLRDLKESDPQAPVDHLGEAWAQVMPSFALDEGGELRMRIFDPAGRFNLNSLVLNGQVNTAALAQFQRLLLVLQIDRPYAERLRDWLDADLEPSGGYGAEDGQYLLQQPAYRAANRPLADVSELRLLLEMDAEDYRKLLPFVNTLPADTPLNVNTAEAPVLASLAEGVSLRTAQEWVEARGRQGFRDLQQVREAMPGAQPGQGLALSSQYFEVLSEMAVGDRRQVLRSTLHRTADGKVYVLGRDLGVAGVPPEPMTSGRE